MKRRKTKSAILAGATIFIFLLPDYLNDNVLFLEKGISKLTIFGEVYLYVFAVGIGVSIMYSAFRLWNFILKT